MPYYGYLHLCRVVASLNSLYHSFSSCSYSGRRPALIFHAQLELITWLHRSLTHWPLSGSRDEEFFPGNLHCAVVLSARDSFMRGESRSGGSLQSRWIRVPGGATRELPFEDVKFDRSCISADAVKSLWDTKQLLH